MHFTIDLLNAAKRIIPVCPALVFCAAFSSPAAAGNEPAGTTDSFSITLGDKPVSLMCPCILDVAGVD